jgi:uncharacterized protein
MQQIKKVWHYLVIEPFTWIFFCFFQPNRFSREYKRADSATRVISMLRLALPLFLISYLFAIIISIFIQYFLPILEPAYFSVDGGFVLAPNADLFLLAMAWATFLGILFGMSLGVGWDIGWGIAIGCALGIVTGITWYSFYSSIEGASEIFVVVYAGGLAGIFAGGSVLSIERINRAFIRIMTSGIMGGIMGGVAGTIATVIAAFVSKHDITSHILLGTIWGIVTGMLMNAGRNVSNIFRGKEEYNVHIGSSLNFLESVMLGIGSGTVGGIGVNALIDITRGIFAGVGRVASVNVIGIEVAIVAGIIGGIASNKSKNVVGRITLTIFMATLLATLVTLMLTAIVNSEGSVGAGIIVGIAFIVSYIPGYYRLPLYPVSGFSGLRAYLASRKNPLQVFTYLHRCSLYWDEYIYFPLLGLKQMLLIAAELNTEQALEEIGFIVAERPQQINAARAASLEIAIRDLEMRDNLRDIAHASQRLAEILPQEMGLVDPRWVTPFARLNDASRDAASYCSPLGWQARREALKSVIGHLKKVYPNTAFGDAQLNKRLGEIVNTWRAVVQDELEALEESPEKTSQTENPYNPGPILELRDSLFVGRRDLAQQLGEALGRGRRRPTFLLNGERRMGKSSTLKQLPDLLGAHYLPISYDLQIRGISSSAAAFLGALAEEIYRAMSVRGMRIKRMEYERLQEASQQNEATVYHVFDEWLKRLEKVLEHEDRTLLFAFDEFEKLEEAGQDGYLNLRLLLDWFRSVIQNRPRLALLFSGTHTFGDLRTNWAGYFVNVQTLKVSFLHPAEAQQLITQPVPGFPGEQIFGEGVVEEIICLTNCHPFLVQAVCSALMDHLNAEKRNRAEISDVAIAVNQVLNNWWSTYFRDLWERTDDDQRACLIALTKMDKGDILHIEQQSGLEGKRVHCALEALLERDLVLLDEQGNYCITAPIFRNWVTRSDYG